jgi:DUF1680 family protein
MLIRSTLSILLAAASFPAFAQSGITKLNPVSFSQVTITDNFWKPKLEKIATTAVPVMIYQTEIATGRIRNYEKVARQQNEKHEGIYYDDSDVYKALEAIAYSLKNHSDKAMEPKADEWIDKIPAVVHHVDGTARPQIVNKDRNSSFYNIISAYHQISGYPVVLNTSLNAHGEPINNYPNQVIKHLLDESIDYIVTENFIIKKRK